MLITLGKAAVQRAFRRFGREIRHVEPPVREDPKFAWVGKLGIQTVIDIGANMGEFSQMMTRLLPNCRIYAFEPLEECVAAIRQTLAGYPKLQVFQTALGNKSGTVAMHKNALTYASSLLENTELHLESYPELRRSSMTVTVPVATLDEVARELQLESGLLIKIDVEGYTEPVIEGGNQTLRRADVIIIEASYWPLYQGQVLFDWVYDALRENGLRYVGNVKQQVSPVDGSILQADAVFLSEAAYRRLGTGLRAAQRSAISLTNE